MRIDVWSDVVCPWCYIGKRRLEKALATFSAANPEADVEIFWRSFETNPGAPAVPVESVAEAVGRKYGGGLAAGRAMVDRAVAAAAEEGMTWRHHTALRVNTMTAHRLLHWALHEGGLQTQARLKQALFEAYFEKERNIADASTLIELARSVGLDPARAEEVIEGDDFADEVEADIRQATALGANGVPFFVIDQKYGISGAQPVEFFEQVIDRAWAESRPLVTLLEPEFELSPQLSDSSAEIRERSADIGESSAMCGPDGCTI